MRNTHQRSTKKLVTLGGALQSTYCSRTCITSFQTQTFLKLIVVGVVQMRFHQDLPWQKFSLFPRLLRAVESEAFYHAEYRMKKVFHCKDFANFA